jgi:hypothetical protein
MDLSDFRGFVLLRTPFVPLFMALIKASLLGLIRVHTTKHITKDSTVTTV